MPQWHFRRPQAWQASPSALLTSTGLHQLMAARCCTLNTACNSQSLAAATVLTLQSIRRGTTQVVTTCLHNCCTQLVCTTVPHRHAYIWQGCWGKQCHKYSTVAQRGLKYLMPGNARPTLGMGPIMACTGSGINLTMTLPPNTTSPPTSQSCAPRVFQ